MLALVIDSQQGRGGVFFMVKLHKFAIKCRSVERTTEGEDFSSCSGKFKVFIFVFLAYTVLPPPLLRKCPWGMCTSASKLKQIRFNHEVNGITYDSGNRAVCNVIVNNSFIYARELTVMILEIVFTLVSQTFCMKILLSIVTF